VQIRGLLLKAPEDIAALRQQAFHLVDKMEWATTTEFDRVWPFFQNFWTTARLPYRAESKSTTTHNYRCLFHKKKTSAPTNLSARQRKKQTRVAISCPRTMKVVKYDDGRVEMVAQGSDPHNHPWDLADIKNPSPILRQYAGAQAELGWTAAQTYGQISGSRPGQLGDQVHKIGGQHFSRQHVANAGRAYRQANPDDRLVGNNYTEEVQMADGKRYLDSLQDHAMGAWYCEPVEAVRELDGKPTHALLWASQEGIDTLARRGHLALMDATHKTNWLDWLLYTIMVRDEAGSWLPVSHFVTKTSDGDIVGAALRKTKDWARRNTAQGREWSCRYFLTDDSAVEQKAIRIAFPGLEGGEMEVSCLLCRVHSERTLRRNLAGSACQASLQHMLHALRNRKTRAGCEESVQKAIKAAPGHKKQYLVSSWLARMEMWANFAREHSTLLLQVCFYSTSASLTGSC
jgi:hypothetical protein